MKKLLDTRAGVCAFPRTQKPNFFHFMLIGCGLLFATALQAQDSRIAMDIAEHATAFEQLSQAEPLSPAEGVSVQSKSLTTTVREALFYTLNTGQIAEILQDRPELLSLRIKHRETTWDLHLQAAEVMTENFAVYAASDKQTPFAYERGAYYWGVVSGKAGSLVALAISRDEIMGFVQIGDRNYTLGKLDGEQTHILYETDDLMKDQGVTCFVDDTHQIGTGGTDVSPDRQLLTNCVKM
jgi:hypothetical protein